MISVIIPLYNKESIIEQSLRSVLSQDYKDFEVIVVNDGSTDSSADIVRSIHDPHIRFFEQENGGPSKARNTGVKHAKGEWIVFLDADDEFLPGALSSFMKIANSHAECDFVVTSFMVRKADGNTYRLSNCEGIISNPFKKHCFNLLVPHTGSTMYKKELVLKCPFNENLRRYEDFDTWFRMYRQAKIIASKTVTFVLNSKYAEASKGRRNIKEDFLGHLEFGNKSFWEKQCLYRLYIEERTNYGLECRRLYRMLLGRIDYLFLYKLWMFLRRTSLAKYV